MRFSRGGATVNIVYPDVPVVAAVLIISSVKRDPSRE
jgi:hypothetical protein